MADRTLKVTAILDDRLSGELNRIGKTAGAALVTGLAAAGAAVAVGLGSAVKASTEFNHSLSGIAAVGGREALTRMDEIRAKAMQLGEDTVFSASEAARGMEELVKAGVPVSDVLTGAADAAVSLAAAGGIDLAKAASIASAAMNTFNIAGKDMAGVVDLISGAANVSAIDVNQFGLSLAQFGAVANLVGLSIKDTSIAIAAMGDAGIKGSDAGTSLKTMFMNLIPVTDRQIAKFKELGIVTADGSNRFFDATGKAKGYRDISEILSESLAGLSEAQKISALDTMFGSDAIRAASVAANLGAKGYDELDGAISAVTAKMVAGLRLNNLTGDLQMLSGSVDTLKIIVGDALDPILRRATQAATIFVNTGLIPMAKQFAANLPTALANATARIREFGSALYNGIVALAPILIPALALIGLTISVSLVTALYNATIALGHFTLSMLTYGVASIVRFGWSLTTHAVMGLLTFVGYMVTTAIPNIVRFATILATQGVGAALLFASSITTGAISAVLKFAAILITQGVGAATAYVISMLATVNANAAAGASFLLSLIPQVMAASTAFLVNLIPNTLAAVAALGRIVVSAILAGNAFLVKTIPALLLTAATFTVNLITAITSTAAAFIASIPAILAQAGTFLASLIPTLIATAASYLSMAATAIISLAGMVAAAVSAGVAFVIANLPIILTIGAVGLALYLLWRNWAAIWGAIVKYTGGAAKGIAKGVSWLGKTVFDLVKKLGSFLAKQFTNIFGGVLKMGKEWVSKLSAGIRKGLAGMASKVMQIMKELGSRLWNGMKDIVNGIIDIIMHIPMVESIVGVISKVSGGVGNFIGAFKDSFDAGGDEAGSSFVDRLTTSIDEGLAAAGIDFSINDAIDNLMPEMPNAGAMPGMPGGGGGGAAGAAGTDNPLGMWSGTDSQGHWTIDPATGAKIYDAGSVGALKQQNAASEQAAREAAKAAKAGAKARSGVGEAVEKGLASKDAIDLSKAFSEAVSGSIKAMAELVGARIPSPESYGPKLAAIQAFWVDVGKTFAAIFQHAAITDRDKAPAGALIRGDLEGLGIGADAMERVFGALESVTRFMGQLGTLKKIPPLAALETVRSFALAAVEIGKEISTLLTKEGAELLSPVADALGKTVDAIGKTADLLTKPFRGGAPSENARTALADTLRWIGGFANSLLRGSGYDLTLFPDETISILRLATDIMTTLGAGVDMMGKAVALITGDLRKVKAPSEDAKRGLEETLRWIGGFASGLLKRTGAGGYDLTVDRDRTALDLAAVKEIFLALSAGMDSLTKAADFGAKADKFRAVAAASFAALANLMIDVAGFASGLLRNDGSNGRAAYDLTLDPDRVKGDLALVRDVLATIGAGLDTFVKAAGLKVGRVALITQGVIDIAVDNSRRVVAGLAALTNTYFDAAGVMSQTLVNLKAFTDASAGAVDFFIKVSGLKLDKAVLVASEILVAVEHNARAMIDTVQAVAARFWDAADEAYMWTAPLKEFADQAGPAVDLFTKLAGFTVDLSKLAEITAESASLVGENVTAILREIVFQANRWKLAEEVGLLEPLAAFVVNAGQALDLFADAAGISVDWENLTELTDDNLSLVGENVTSILRQITFQANRWREAIDVGLLEPVKDFVDSAGSAVSLMVDAAGISVDWASVSEIPSDMLGIVGDNIHAALLEITRIAGYWRMADDTLDPLIGIIKDYVDSAGAAVALVTDAAGLGAALAAATEVSGTALGIAGRNAEAALGRVKELAKTYSDMAKEARESLFESVKEYASVAGESIDLIIKAATLSEALAGAHPVGRGAFTIVADHIKFAIDELGRVMGELKGDVLDDARRLAESASPVVDAISKVIDAFSIEKLVGSKFFDTKTRSAHSAGGAATRAQAFANQVKAGIKLIFKTLAETVSEIGPVDPGIASHIAGIVAAYDPLLDLIAKLSGLTIDLKAIRDLAQVPGILGAGLTGAGAGGGMGGVKPNNDFRIVDGGAASTAGSNVRCSIGAAPENDFRIVDNAKVNPDAWIQRGSKGPGIDNDSRIVDGIVKAFNGPILDAWIQRGSIGGPGGIGIPGAGTSGYGGAADNGAGPYGGSVLLTGPATITGPVTFQGTQVVEVYLDGKIIDRTVKSGSFNNARNRSAAMP